ncbi:hypothetical protein CALVIDRAFT_531834 [Calocera viscosa TUFC12733]|uniref:Uncharacterized protein n=1 Tax=Calocera viscosa (strain TUFC12733) TaxID=1330018 RepID=A0A167FTM9_CALVF|nr:hypothetical protein CALVIDRAFT_531834 [Calocera viscosa TUFC12733]
MSRFGLSLAHNLQGSGRGGSAATAASGMSGERGNSAIFSPRYGTPETLSKAVSADPYPLVWGTWQEAAEWPNDVPKHPHLKPPQMDPQWSPELSALTERVWRNGFWDQLGEASEVDKTLIRNVFSDPERITGQNDPNKLNLDANLLRWMMARRPDEHGLNLVVPHSLNEFFLSSARRATSTQPRPAGPEPGSAYHDGQSGDPPQPPQPQGTNGDREFSTSNIEGTVPMSPPPHPLKTKEQKEEARKAYLRKQSDAVRCRISKVVNAGSIATTTHTVICGMPVSC